MSKKISELPIIASLEEGDQLTALDVSALPAEQNVRITKANLQAGLAKTGDDAANFGSGAATNGQVLTADGAGNSGWENPAGGSGHIIADEGVQLPAQSILNFVGAGVTATDGTGETVVTITGGGGGGVDNPLTADLDVGTFDIIGTAGNNVGFMSDAAAGVDPVAFDFDTSTALSTASQRCISVKNTGTELFGVAPSGKIHSYYEDAGSIAIGDANTASARTTGTYNIAIGSSALRYNRTGAHNVAIGRQAMSGGNNRQQERCVAVGSSAFTTAMNGNADCVFIGYNSRGTGSGNIVIGSSIDIGAQEDFLNLGGALVGNMRASSDVALTPLSLTGPAAFASATTNLVGGALVLSGGDGASGSAGDAHGGDVKITGGQQYGTGNVGNIIMSTLPTSDPGVAGALWNNAGVLNISAG